MLKTLGRWYSIDKNSEKSEPRSGNPQTPKEQEAVVKAHETPLPPAQQEEAEEMWKAIQADGGEGDEEWTRVPIEEKEGRWWLMFDWLKKLLASLGFGKKEEGNEGSSDEETSEKPSEVDEE